MKKSLFLAAVVTLLTFSSASIVQANLPSTGERADLKDTPVVKPLTACRFVLGNFICRPIDM